MADLQTLLDAADDALDRDDLSGCLDVLRSGLEQYPENVELLARHGRALRFSARDAEAVSVLQRAASLDPTHPTVLYDLGMVLRHQGKAREALEVHDRLRAAHPNQRDARFAAAITRALLGHPDDALPEMAKLVAEDPQDQRARFGLAQTYLRLGRFTEALHIFDVLLAEDGEFIDALLGKAEAARNLQRNREWMETARRAHDLSPSDADTHYQMQLVCMEDADLNGATSHLLRALELKPDHAEARAAMADLLWKVNRLTQAQEKYERATAIAPWNGDITGRQALFLLSTGRGKPNLNQLENEARSMPYAGLPYQLGRIYTKTVIDPGKAEQFLKLTLDHGPERVDALRLLTDLYMEQERNAEAIACLRRIVELSPELGVAWKGLAYCLAHEHKTAEALQAHAKASRLLPDDFSIFQGYGATLIQAGEMEQAVRTLQRALELRPDSGHSFFLLALALEGAGRKNEALEAARRANERLPQDQDVHALLERLRGSERQ